MRISTGVTVNVSAQVERWFSELRAGRCFGSVTSTGPVAANFAEVQLFNPVASGITVLAYKIVGDNAVAAALQMRTFNTALATLAGNGVNMLSGGAASVAELRSTNVVAADGTLFWSKAAPAVTPVDLGDLWIIELGAGEGLLVACNAVNINVRTTFLWNEV